MNKLNFTKMFRKNFLKLIAVFSIGILSINLQAQDCTEIMACNNLVQVSLGSDCTETVVADMILEGQTFTNDFYDVVTTNANGSIVTGNVLTRAHIGKTLSVSVTLNGCALSCWGNITVEDKLPPIISNCPSATVACGASTAPGVIPRPTAVDACGGTVTLTSADREVISQCTALYVKVITRTWTATDASGNKATCQQTINITRPTIDNVTFPRSYDGEDLPAFQCAANIRKLPNGAPHPDVTGYPGGADCPNIMFYYEDIIFPICGASIKVLRQWNVIDWCTGRDTLAAQIIKIIDDQAPVCASANDFRFNANTDEGKCTGSFVVPAPTVTFECSGWSYTVGYKLRDASGQPTVNQIFDNVRKTTRPDGTYFYTISNLPADTSWVVYNLIDDCGNTSQCFTEVIVKDKESPSPVCEGFTVIALEENGLADLKATSLDDGSYDNCGVVKYEIKRLTNNCGRPQDLLFSDKVIFCCNDLSPNPTFYHRAVLRIYDEAGNFSECIGNVKVQDKKAPTIEVPPNVTLDCGADKDNLALTGGRARGFDACLDTVTYSDSGTLRCGLGVITRTWTARDKGGLTTSKSQLITIRDSRPFSEADITWPRDLEVNGCSKSDATPEILNSKPSYVNSDCADVAISYNDEVFNVPGACLKILRTWRAIDWCNANTQNPVYFSYVQKITLKNTAPPTVVSGCGNRTITSPNSDCEEYVEHSITATDDCTSPELLRYTWEYDEDNNGTVDQTGTGSFYAKVYPAGRHKFTFKIKDICENIASCSYIFTVKDNKAPTPICHSELVWGLDEQGKAEVWASDFDLKSIDLCDGDDLDFYFDKNKTLPAQNFTCANVPNGVSARIPLKMYVFDQDGNSEFCDVTLILQDSPQNNACTNTGNLTASISGKVINKINDGFEEINVDLINVNENLASKSKTDKDGLFSFKDVPYFNEYKLSPVKQDDILNGISTLDLVLIQRHILGVKQLDNPFDILAADINKDKKVSALDLVSLRKVILGVDSKFNNNNPWRFIPSNHVFADPKQPHEVNENIIFDELNTDLTNVDFTAIKVGDVNNSATYTLRNIAAENRSNAYQISSQTAFKNGITHYTIFAEESENISGIQLSIAIGKNSNIKNITSSLFDIKSENFAVQNGILKLSIGLNKNLLVNKGEKILNIEMQNSSEIIELVQNQLNSEIYTSQLEERAIQLINSDFNDNQANGFTTHVSPNPFNDYTTISFVSPEDNVWAKVTITDLTGKIIYTNDVQSSRGKNQLNIQSQDLNRTSGVYIYQIELQGRVSNGKIILTN